MNVQCVLVLLYKHMRIIYMYTVASQTGGSKTITLSITLTYM